MVIVSQYNYLGLLLTEFLSYDEMAKAVPKCASCSLGLLASKCKINGVFKYSTFTNLFDYLVWSVIEYGASLCAFLWAYVYIHQICFYMVIWVRYPVILSNGLLFLEIGLE